MKNLSIILFSFIIITLIYSCNKNKYEAISTRSTFVFVNEAGEDIFNINTPNHIDTSEFSVYTNDDNIQRLNFIYTIDAKTEFEIWINGEMNMEGTTYFKFGDFNIDTVFAKFQEKGNTTFIKELYYNNKLIDQKSNWPGCDSIHIITVHADSLN